MASILDSLVDKQGGQMRSVSWYRNAINNFTGSISARRLMNQGRLTSRPSAGLLNMFFYDPKMKKTLPLYDTFPLVLPLESYSGGFLGLNFHYLRPGTRFRLLEVLQQYATNNKMNSTTRIQADYSQLKNLTMAKPGIKRYLNNHVRSSFLRVSVEQAAIAVFLPVQQFKKGQPY